MVKSYGPIALLGSGETSLAGGRIFELVARNLPPPLRIAIVETPAGFELNSAQVAGRVAEFLELRQKIFILLSILFQPERGEQISVLRILRY